MPTYPELLARKAAPCPDGLCHHYGDNDHYSECPYYLRPAIEAAVREAIERCIGVTHAMVFAEPWLVVDALRSLLTEEVPDEPM
jgi:Rad3-related DNA helicase